MCVLKFRFSAAQVETYFILLFTLSQAASCMEEFKTFGHTEIVELYRLFVLQWSAPFLTKQAILVQILPTIFLETILFRG